MSATTTTRCAWCAAERGEAGGPGTSHGICERHAAEMLSEAQQLNGHRPDQIAFSVFVCLGCGALGFVLGIAVAVWRVTQ